MPIPFESEFSRYLAFAINLPDMITDIGMDDRKYIDIRPYKGGEEKAALKRIALHPLINDINSYLNPGSDPLKFREFILSLGGVDDFQAKVMFGAINKIISDTSTRLTCSGIENLYKNKKQLFLSNHRDIILDPAIIEVILHQNYIETSQMAVGDNLITDSFFEDVARSNKMIKVIRSGNPKDIYNASALLSEYIRLSITENHNSVWIAQRNGRTKNGMDVTEQGVLKMLDMSGKDDFINDFAGLSITPISVSYQYEPCDLLKTNELYISKRTKYVKSPGEDLNSILTGIMQFKGNIHIHFSAPLTLKELEECVGFEKNERFTALANRIDSKIIDSYKLWNTNYIAYDILNGLDKYKDHYTPEDKKAFENYCNFKLSDIEGDHDEFREILLSIYSNPVSSFESLKRKQ